MQAKMEMMEKKGSSPGADTKLQKNIYPFLPNTKNTK